MIKVLNYDNFSELINPNCTRVQVMKLWHEGCPMCGHLKLIYEKVAEIYKDDFDFYEIDVIADRHRVALRILQTVKQAPISEINVAVPEIYFYHNRRFKEIPWPQKPEKSGYSEEYLKTFFDHYKWFRSLYERRTKF